MTGLEVEISNSKAQVLSVLNTIYLVVPDFTPDDVKRLTEEILQRWYIIEEGKWQKNQAMAQKQKKWREANS